MNEESIKNLYKIASTLNGTVQKRIINFLQDNNDGTLCMAEICEKCGLNTYRAYYYFGGLKDIGVIHFVQDGTKSLVFLDKDRLQVYEQTAEYLEINMEPRSKKRDKKLYG